MMTALHALQITVKKGAPKERGPIDASVREDDAI